LPSSSLCSLSSLLLLWSSSSSSLSLPSYRLTQPLPFDFPSKGFNLAVPKGAYAPYNAQATLHLYSALWSLMLPVTIHGRVSDIWRGYAAQRIMSMLNLRLLFSPSLVKQVRNEHNYLADFDSENDLYLRSQKLLEQLQAWQPTQTGIYVYIHIYMYLNIYMYIYICMYIYIPFHI
jgi:hypothetical protein